MKKVFLLAVLCLINTVTFARTKVSSKFQCTAHYYLTVFYEGKEYLIYTEIQASTCAIAMDAAKAAAQDIVREM